MEACLQVHYTENQEVNQLPACFWSCAARADSQGLFADNRAGAQPDQGSSSSGHHDTEPKDAEQQTCWPQVSAFIMLLCMTPITLVNVSQNSNALDCVR